MKENFNNGKDENVNLTILNEINKAAKMGMDSISNISEKVQNSDFKNDLNESICLSVMIFINFPVKKKSHRRKDGSFSF